MRRRTEWDIAGPPGTDGDAERPRSLMSPDPDAKPRTPRPIAPKQLRFADVPPIAGLAPEVARERRRVGMEVRYGPEFDLTAEVAAILDGLPGLVSAVLQEPILVLDAQRVDRYDPDTGAFSYTAHFGANGGNTRPGWSLARPQIRGVVDAVQALWESLVKFLADEHALTAVTLVAVHGVRDTPLAVTDEQISTGTWGQVLDERLAPLAADLTAYTAKSTVPPNQVDAVSLELVRGLRPIDDAATVLRARVMTIIGMRKATRRVLAEREAAERAAERESLARLGL